MASLICLPQISIVSARLTQLNPRIRIKTRVEAKARLGVGTKDREIRVLDLDQNARIDLLFSAPVNKGDEDKQKYYVNTGYAIRTLRDEFPQLFDIEISFGIYRIDDNAGRNIILLNGTGSTFWSTSSLRPEGNPGAQLLDSENLDLRDGTSDDIYTYLWQSLIILCDTLLPGIKLGTSLTANRNLNLSLWNNDGDPSTGIFTYYLDRQGLAQYVLRRGWEIMFRTGLWDGVQYGVLKMKSISMFHPIVVGDTEDVYHAFENNEHTTISRLVVTQLQHLKWDIKCCD
ncbi:hypothetical protein GIB67_000057 [Kingdonia uniflora]|uniref:Bulb-type lectin domain-containing protein n=1 Tax=Kingdonia uniflora TaxID=39325 RepID=A0A7J7MEV7_9MAGN|nr:hypothetical protein GIB67_000057 [Kingdonia uniflora]